VLILTTLSFIALTAFVIVAGASAADVAVRTAVLSLSSPPVIAIMKIINAGGDWRVLFPGTVALFLVFERARPRWWVWAALMIVAPLSEQAMKHLVGRPRPEAESFGFPSGHTTAAAAFFGALIYLAGSLPGAACRIVRVLAVLAIVGVGCARIMLRAHWPSDVLGGAALGLALASLATMIATVPTVSAGGSAAPS
jgi:undecaprenyl-diphosphatase